MLRVNIDSISNENGRYYYRGGLFTGVAFFLNDCKVERSVEIKGGALHGEYFNEYLFGLDGLLKVDSDCLEPEDEGEEEPLCYGEERFSGIAYDFDDGFCTGELCYTRGWLGSQVGYYKSGILGSIELIDEDFSQKIYWYENGQIKRYEIFERNSFDISLGFEENGEITVLSIDGDYFDRVGALRNKIKFYYFDDKKFSAELTGADYLYVSGSAVDDELFDGLLANNGLSNTSKLRICRTPLTATSLEKLIPIKNIAELFVESEALALEDLQNFKSQRPDCFVEFNREEVTV